MTSTLAIRGDALTLLDYFDGNSDLVALESDAVAKRLRSQFPGRISIAVVDPHSDRSRQLFETLLTSGAVRAGDAITLVVTRPNKAPDFAFADIVADTDFDTRIVQWKDRKTQQHLTTRSFDVVVIAAERAKDAQVFEGLGRFPSLALIGLAADERQHKVFITIAGQVGRAKRAVFTSWPGKPHYIPLVTDGTDRSASEYLKRASECLSQKKRGSCGDASCPALYSRALIAED